ncbi:hypothetical protein [Hyphobacterium sp.]|uniref:hypothetical protein n=1 Tax=Hyphobacterium sp. TaxID=2004662 RepID=UPI003BABDDA6
MYKYLLIGGASLLLAACQTTSDSANAMPQQTASATMSSEDGATEGVDPDAEICRRVQQTGTRFQTRVCMTQAEWDAQQEDASEAARVMQRNIEPNCGVSGSC